MPSQKVMDALHGYELTNMLKPLDGRFKPDVGMPELPHSGDQCPYPVTMTCDARLAFRTFDGSCNNLNSPITGRAMTPYQRLLPAKYGDGQLH